MSLTIRSFTKNTVFKVILQRSPNGLKRLVFLASFIAFVSNVSKPEKSFIRNINQILCLSRGGDSSLELPVRLSKVLWGDKEIFLPDIKVLNDKASTTELRRLAAAHIAMNVPGWFRYSNIEAISQDICNYFSYMNNATFAH